MIKGMIDTALSLASIARAAADSTCLPLRTAAAIIFRVKQSGWETISSERHFANPHIEVVT